MQFYIGYGNSNSWEEWIKSNAKSITEAQEECENYFEDDNWSACDCDTHTKIYKVGFLNAKEHIEDLAILYSGKWFQNIA